MKLKPEKWTFLVLMTVLMSVLVFGLRPVPAYADDGEIASGECGDDLTWTIDSDYVLTISGTGEMTDATYSTTLWSVDDTSYRDQITKIVVEDGVTDIGDYAFYSCTSVTEVTLADSVTSIGSNAFCYCKLLTEITLPESVTTIGNSAFYNCKALASVEIPDSVTSLGAHAFNDCDALTSVTIPSSITTIKSNTFYHCDSLQSVTIPTSVTSIEYYAFADCSALSAVNYGGSPVEWKTISMGYGAGLDDVTVNYTLTGEPIASGTCGDDLDWTLSEEGVLTISGSGEMSEWTGNSYNDDPWPGWHDWSAGIVKVILPEGITSIGGCAFYGCSNLTEITLPEGITSIGSRAFYNCSSLTTLEIPSGVTTIKEYAFNYCTGLKSISLSDSLTTIKYRAFAGCSSLSSISIPSSVTTLESGMFSNCTSLQEVVLCSGLESIGSSAFFGCTALTPISLPDSLKSVGNQVFYGCTALSAISLPDGVESIGYYAFYNCTSLASVTLPDGLFSIDYYAFYNCTALTDVTIPDSLTSLGASAFEGCSSLTAMTLPANLAGIGTAAIPSAVTITGYSNSPAYYYANKNGNEFVSLGEVEIETIYVSTSSELKEAIGSYRRIILEDGDYYFGYTLTIKEVTALTIEAEHSGEAEILSTYLYDAVVYLTDCYNIEINGVIMGHTSVTFGSCGDNGVVLDADDCTDIRLVNCDLFGCGTIAVVLSDVDTFTADDCVMRDCMVYFANVYESSATFTDCVISGNAYSSSYRSKYSCIEYYNYDGDTAQNLIFNSCSFLGNYNSALCDSDDVDYIEFDENCIFEQNAWQDETPDTCGICLNGITWSVEDGVLSLGYGLEYDDGTTITSATGAVPTYSEYSVPWKGLTWSTLQLADGVTYEYEKEDPGLAYGASTSLTVGKTTTITASADSGGTITFTSSDTSVLTVDSDGVVTALKAGTASVEIAVAATDRYASKSVTLTFKISEPTTEAEETTTAATEETTTAAAEESTTAATEESTTAAAEETTTAAATTSKKSQTLTVSKSTTTLAVGKTWTPTVSGAKTTLSYKSADTSIATVNASTGKIKAVKVGTVKITVTAAATTAYSKATATITVKVTPKATSSLKLTNMSSGIKLTWKKVTGATGYYIYRSTSKSGTYKKIATVKSGSTVTYTNKTSGTYKVTNGKTYYYKVIAYASTGTGTASSVKTTVRLTGVTLSSVKNSASKKMTVKWKKNSKATGYQIQYSTSSSFASGNKTVSVSKAATVSKTIGSLKKGKTYYVRIRAYKTVSGTKYYSAWSAKKKVKISK
ncbi:MAG: leucine-rich repeat protein [Lachnospiraceae bacterium]|nr:leucine-rich repeat protein [Lachnospiraceae bacterium]